MADNEQDDQRTPWDDFKPIRRDRREDSVAARIFVSAVFLVAGALGGAAFGFFLPVILLPRRRKLEWWSQTMDQMAEGSLPRVLIGAAVGVAATGSWLWRKR